jgi:flagellar assembly protein FliH
MSVETNRVLKANSVRGLGSNIAFNYDDFRRRCDEHLEAARRQAQQLLTEARAQAEEARASAQSAGFAAGRSEGLRQAEVEIETRARERGVRQAREHLQTALPALQAAAAALAEERDRWLAEWESAAVRLSVAIAEKILRHELTHSPQLASGMLREALKLAAGQRRITLRMHPRDIQQLGGCPEQVLQSLASCGDAVLAPDDTISPGGCEIETEHGVIDARLETQLERFAAELLH